MKLAIAEVDGLEMAAELIEKAFGADYSSYGGRQKAPELESQPSK
jgi:hypothetical protein